MIEKMYGEGQDVPASTGVPIFKAVSYTHLDVYKRQILSFKT